MDLLQFGTSRGLPCSATNWSCADRSISQVMVRIVGGYPMRALLRSPIRGGRQRSQALQAGRRIGRTDRLNTRNDVGEFGTGGTSRVNLECRDVPEFGSGLHGFEHVGGSRWAGACFLVARHKGLTPCRPNGEWSRSDAAYRRAGVGSTLPRSGRARRFRQGRERRLDPRPGAGRRGRA